MGAEEPPLPAAAPEPPPLTPPPAAGNRPNRKQVVIAGATIVAVVIAATLAVVLVNRHSPSPTPHATSTPGTATSGITNEDQLVQAITTQGWTPLRAEQLFALDVGPLPGVSVQGITPTGEFDASMAVTGLYGQWNHLTAAQKAAAKTDLNPPQTQSRISRRPMGPSADAVLLGNTNTPAFDYQALADSADHDEALYAETGTVEFTLTVLYTQPPNPKEYAESSLFGRASDNAPWVAWHDGCHVVVFNPRFVGLDAASAAAVVAHEMWHCYQYQQEGTGANWETVAPWIQEGEATWVMDELDPNATVEAKAWNTYVNTPGTPYLLREYDAVGVYGHEGDITGDQKPIWLQLLPMVTAEIGHNDFAALTLLMSSDSTRFYSSWAASYYEDQTHNDWHMAGPSTPPTTGPSPDMQHINNGDTTDIATDPTFRAHPLTIDGSADILIVVLAAGYGEAHDQDYAMERTLTNTAPLALCQKTDGCKCPDGSAGASQVTIPSVGLVSLGLEGGDTGIAAYAAGVSLDKYCKQPDPPPPAPGPAPPPGGGGGGGGGGGDEPPPPPAISEGDPHITTFDGLSYDLQAAGEFTLVKSTVDDFLVQARQVPVPGAIPVAVNQAIAAKLGGHRVTLTVENGVLVARVDGVADNTGGSMNVGTGTLERLGTDAGTGFLLEWPDATTVEVDQLGLVGLNVTIKPAAARAGTLTGLLGNDNGQPGDDLVTSEGVTLDTPTPQTLDQQFADSWRITQAQSLFDYKPGQTTATFTNKSFPPTYVDGTNVPGAAAATQECQADGVTDQYLLADCVLDATAIKSPAVVSHYAQAQVVKTVQTNLAKHLPPFTAPTAGGGPTPTPGTASPTPNLQGVLIDSGRVNSPDETQAFPFTAQAGDILWFGQPGCDDGQLAFAVVDPSGQTLNPDDVTIGLFGCQMGRIVATTTGTYQLVANADKKSAGSYGVPIRFESPDTVSQISYGQTVSGSVPDQATHAVYQFAAQAGDVIHIFGSGCNIGSGNSIVGLADSTGKPVGAALDCTQASLSEIPSAGTYELVVNFGNLGPFSYQFTLQKGTG